MKKMAKNREKKWRKKIIRKKGKKQREKWTTKN